MNRQYPKTTVALVFLIVGSLASAWANSGEQYENTEPDQAALPAGVEELSPQAVKELGFTDGQVAVVFTVDKNGDIQVFAPKGNKVSEKTLPLSAGSIEKLETITTFKTTNPKICWKVFGSTVCVSW